ncbi:MAG: alpha/beta hydrolase [Thermoanaerobaculia bacterium]
MKSRIMIAPLIIIALAVLATPLYAQSRRTPTWRERGGSNESITPGIRTVHDVRYGEHAEQLFDVYIPQRATNAPVIFMVHGGGWRRGDKELNSVVRNKVNRWVPQGFVVISANYRMLPDATPLEQAEDIARAIGVAQQSASKWGASRRRFILMGHSAGGHLVALTASMRLLLERFHVERPIGLVLLDSAALDVEELMRQKHLPLFDDAFGSDPGVWRASSPYHVLDRSLSPLLVVCAARRDDSCAQARKFARKAESLGTRTEVRQVDLSHREINEDLGMAGAYTDAVEDFFATLDVGLRRQMEPERGSPPWRRRD